MSGSISNLKKWSLLAQKNRALYPVGTRIELQNMDDPYQPVPPGTRGTVAHVDDVGTIHMKWDNGRTLGLCSEVDSFRKLTVQELEEEQFCNGEASSVENFKHLSSCSDFAFLRDNLTRDDLSLLDGIIGAYIDGKTDIEIIRDEDDQIDFDKSFNLIVNDEAYVPMEGGLDVLAIKWYEGFEDTGYLYEAFHGCASRVHPHKPALDEQIKSAEAICQGVRPADHTPKAPVPTR